MVYRAFNTECIADNLVFSTHLLTYYPEKCRFCLLVLSSERTQMKLEFIMMFLKPISQQTFLLKFTSKC